MKHFEYVYNVIYYFFYRGYIKCSEIILIPLIPIYRLIYKIPSIKERFAKKGINDPLEWHIKRYKTRILENPEYSLAVMGGASAAMSVVFFIYLGFFHIFRKIFIPVSFYPTLTTEAIVLGILGFLTDVVFSQVGDKGMKYIIEFNKKKGWWRVKWSIITALSPFLAIGFALLTR